MSDTVALACVHSTVVTWSWHESMEELTFWDLSHRQRIYGRGGLIKVHGGTGGLVVARNQAVKDFLRTELDWLFWVDTDMGFAPNTVDRLLEAAHAKERPIVGGLCFAQKLPEVDGMGGFRSLAVPTIYDWRSEEDDKGFHARLEYEPDALVRCAGTGSACVLIHRSVFERIGEAQGPVWYNAVPNLADELIGEDLSFCLRAAILEIPIHVHTGIKTTHYKSVWIGEEHYQALRAGIPAHA